MSTLRINNIEAQSVPASPTIDEKVKVTNSSGDILVNIDGKTSGITTIGINTTDGNIKFDANSNVLITGILTATTLAGNFTPDSLEIGSNIKLGNTGVITATSLDISGDIDVDGHTELDNINISGVSTHMGLSQFQNTINLTHASAGQNYIYFNEDLQFAKNGTGTRLKIDSNGNLVTGAQTSPTSSDTGNIYIKNGSSIGGVNHAVNYVSNAVFNGAWKYINSGLGATRIVVNQNGYQFDAAGSGTAGNNITFSNKFNISSSGAIGFSGAYGSSGQVLTSQGNSSAPTWGTVASGGASNISFNSGYGIDFSATADGTGSSQAEILDDYEEGSWTPAVSSGNASFSTMTGRYTKVGNKVTLWVKISGGGSYSGSGALQINGLPFSNNTAVHPIGNSEYYKIDFARDYSDHVTPYIAGSNLQWLRNNSGGGSGNYLTINLFYNGAAINTCITYYTNS